MSYAVIFSDISSTLFCFQTLNNVSEHHLFRGHSIKLSPNCLRGPNDLFLHVKRASMMIIWGVFGKAFARSSQSNINMHKGSQSHPTMDLLASMFPALRSLPSLSINQSLLVLVTAYLCTKVLLSINAKGPLPPGPRGLPLLGNIFQIPKFQWLKYTEWQEVFGNVFSLSVSFAAEECQVPSSH